MLLGRRGNAAPFFCAGRTRREIAANTRHDASDAVACGKKSGVFAERAKRTFRTDLRSKTKDTRKHSRTNPSPQGEQVTQFERRATERRLICRQAIMRIFTDFPSFDLPHAAERAGQSSSHDRIAIDNEKERTGVATIMTPPWGN